MYHYHYYITITQSGSSLTNVQTVGDMFMTVILVDVLMGTV